MLLKSGDMAGKPPTDRAGLVPSHAKETASGLSSFRQRAPKAEDAAETAAKRAWSGNLNATHLLPCREDNKTQGYMEEMVLMGFDSSFFHE